MIIGYSTNQQSIPTLEKVCDDVYFRNERDQTASSFLTFIEGNQDNQVVIKNIKDIGLQLVQMVPAFLELKIQGKEIIYLEKSFAEELSEEAYNRLLLEFARNEQELMRSRTLSNIKVAQTKGVKYGRPSIDREVIAQIQYLSRAQKWSIREIAKMCNVSVGTVFKYGNEKVKKY